MFTSAFIQCIIQGADGIFYSQPILTEQNWVLRLQSSAFLFILSLNMQLLYSHYYRLGKQLIIAREWYYNERWCICQRHVGRQRYRIDCLNWLKVFNSSTFLQCLNLTNVTTVLCNSFLRCLLSFAACYPSPSLQIAHTVEGEMKVNKLTDSLYTAIDREWDFLFYVIICYSKIVRDFFYSRLLDRLPLYC